MASSAKPSESKQQGPFSFLFQSIDGHGLALFRIAFGVIFVWEMIYLLRIDFALIFLETPNFQFTYNLFPFLAPMPTPAMNALIVLLAGCGVLVALGFFYRIAMSIIALGFSYIFFLDKAYYNNHLYLIVLIAFLMIFMEADKVLSLRRSDKKAANFKIPAWNVWVLKAQLFIVYFYGGIAKLNGDWLFRQQPVIQLLEQKGVDSGLTDLLTSDAFVYFITYGGLAFDLVIGFLLVIPRTRFIGLIAALLFNLMNAWIFDDINIFPYFMMAALVLFVAPETTKAFLEKKLKRNWITKGAATLVSESSRKRIIGVLAIYFLFQLFFPFRHFLVGPNVDWTGVAQRFSWRMKIQNRQTETIKFAVFDLDSKQIYPVDLVTYGLNRDQIFNMSQHPEMARQFAVFLDEYCEQRQQMPNVMVKADIRVSFNGRPPQPTIDRDKDLTKADSSPFAAQDWILPLNTP